MGSIKPSLVMKLSLIVHQKFYVRKDEFLRRINWWVLKETIKLFKLVVKHNIGFINRLHNMNMPL